MFVVCYLFMGYLFSLFGILRRNNHKTILTKTYDLYLHVLWNCQIISSENCQLAWNHIVSVCCLTPFSNFSAISWREQVNFRWDDDEVRFDLDQHAELDFYSASSLKQQSAGRHVAPLGHIILIPSQPVFALSP